MWQEISAIPWLFEHVHINYAKYNRTKRITTENCNDE